MSTWIRRRGWYGGGDPVSACKLSALGISIGRRFGGSTSIMGVCPFTPALRLVFEMRTSRSRPRRLEGTGMVMSRSPIVWVHL